jgi:uncharacterized membrane protein YgcG
MPEVGAEVIKRRAIAVRLLAFVVPIALCLVGVTQATAGLIPPKLDETTPPSSVGAPAFSTSPSVIGEAEPDEIIIDSVPAKSSTLFTSGFAANPTKNPKYEIVVFLGDDCSGPVIGTGTAGALESTGIPVTVSENAKTVMSAKQFDPNDPSVLSDCSNALPYWEGSVPPEGGPGPEGEGEGSNGGSSDGSSSGGNSSSSGGGSSSSSGALGPATPLGPVKPEAPHIHTNPGGVANDISPFVVGSTSAAEAVLVYAGEGCRGAPVAKGSADQLQSGFQVTVAPNAVTTFSAAAIIGQRSACSESVPYTEDSTAPRTRITMAPGTKTRKRKAAFRFKDITEDPPGTTFACKVDKKEWEPCASPFSVKHLKYGHHTVKIRATDLAGNHERKPVSRRFIVIHGS